LFGRIFLAFEGYAAKNDRRHAQTDSGPGISKDKQEKEGLAK